MQFIETSDHDDPSAVDEAVYTAACPLSDLLHRSPNRVLVSDIKRENHGWPREGSHLGCKLTKTQLVPIHAPHSVAGTFQDKIVARLAEDARERALKAGAKQFSPMPGRPMKEYIVVPAADVAKPAALAKWVAQAHAYATTLPEKPKAAKKTTPKAPVKIR